MIKGFNAGFVLGSNLLRSSLLNLQLLIIILKSSYQKKTSFLLYIEIRSSSNQNCNAIIHFSNDLNIDDQVMF